LFLPLSVTNEHRGADKKNKKPSKKQKAIRDSIDHIAQLLTSQAPPRVTVLLGAGISVAAGIPDYRSLGGMYQTLRPELLTASEDQRDMMRVRSSRVLSTEIFQQNPLPCLEIMRPLILGVADQKWQPTLSHRFVQVLHEKGTIQTFEFKL
jgi:NAD-dependent SIR2 family protein deacetylase